MTSRAFKILSIDGGGVRGVFPAAYLNYIQDRIGSTPIHQYFDLIVGTSTGGIIAICLAFGISTKQILELYKTKSKRIFSWSLRKPFAWLVPTYSNANLIEELQGLLGNKKLLGEAKCRLCIPAVDVTNGKALVFKTRHHSDYVNDHKIEAWKVAAATSAAPTFFPALFSDTGGYIDGGLWANNPSIVGIAEAHKMEISLSQMKILSLGTGATNLHRTKWGAILSGKLGWIKKIIPWTFEVQSQAYANIAKYFCGDNYFRVDRQLPCPKIFFGGFDLDSVGRTAELQSFAEYSAKCDFQKIKNAFFNEPVQEFIPLPE